MVPRTDIIDLSSNQLPTAIDWPRAGATGLIGAYLRVGAANAKGIYPDHAAEKHAKGCLSIGRPFGVYFYFSPKQPWEPQAKILADAHKFLGAEFCPMLDVEEGDGDFSTQVMQSLLYVDATLTDGQRTGVYTGPGFWGPHFPGEVGKAFRNRALWVAHYGAEHPDIPFGWDEAIMWQHSGNTIWSDGSFGPVPLKDPKAHIIAQPGKIDGVHGELDCNRLDGSLDNLRRGQQPCSPLDLTQVRDRQRAIRRCGRDPGSLDGLWGSRSSAALTLVQRDLGVPQTHVWDGPTDAAITAAIDATAPTDPPAC